MAILNKIEVTGGGGEKTLDASQGRQVNVKIDLGRTAALALLGIVAYVGAIICFLANQAAGATAFISAGSLILGSGFGLAAGEHAGASEVAAKIRA
jgi:hypothetical protein